MTESTLSELIQLQEVTEKKKATDDVASSFSELKKQITEFGKELSTIPNFIKTIEKAISSGMDPKRLSYSIAKGLEKIDTKAVKDTLIKQLSQAANMKDVFSKFEAGKQMGFSSKDLIAGALKERMGVASKGAQALAAIEGFKWLGDIFNPKTKARYQTAMAMGGGMGVSDIYGRGSMGMLGNQVDINKQAINQYLVSLQKMFGVTNEEMSGALGRGLSIKDIGDISKLRRAGFGDFSQLTEQQKITQRRYVDKDGKSVSAVQTMSGFASMTGELGSTVQELTNRFISFSNSVYGTDIALREMQPVIGRATQLENQGIMRSGTLEQLSNPGGGTIQGRMLQLAIFKKMGVGDFSGDMLEDLNKTYKMKPNEMLSLREKAFGTSGFFTQHFGEGRGAAASRIMAGQLDLGEATGVLAPSEALTSLKQDVKSYNTEAITSTALTTDALAKQVTGFASAIQQAISLFNNSVNESNRALYLFDEQVNLANKSVGKLKDTVVTFAKQ